MDLQLVQNGPLLPPNQEYIGIVLLTKLIAYCYVNQCSFIASIVLTVTVTILGGGGECCNPNPLHIHPILYL